MSALFWNSITADMRKFLIGFARTMIAVAASSRCCPAAVVWIGEVDFMKRWSG
jgi:hypothetical protein